MTLPRLLLREGCRALVKLAQDQGQVLQLRLSPACIDAARNYAAEPAPVDGESFPQHP
jgi:hypothetical protein